MHNFTKLYRMDLPHRAIAVYIYLADRANKDGICGSITISVTSM